TTCGARPQAAPQVPQERRPAPQHHPRPAKRTTTGPPSLRSTRGVHSRFAVITPARFSRTRPVDDLRPVADHEVLKAVAVDVADGHVAAIARHRERLRGSKVSVPGPTVKGDR